MSARQTKNGVLTRTIWNVISPSDIFKLTNPINAAFLISNVKLANPAVFLLSWTKVSSCYNAFNWPMPLVDQVEAPESINNPLNSASLYRESVDKFKT